MRLRQFVVQPQRRGNEPFYVFESCLRTALRPQPAVSQCESRPGSRKIRIQFRRPLEQIRSHALTVPRLAPHIESTHQVKLVRVDVLGRSLADAGALRRRQLYFERIHDGMRDFILHCEDVIKLTVVSLAPQMMAESSIDQLRRDSDAIANLAHAALDDVSDIKLSRYLADIDRPALESERRVTRCHRQGRDL